MEGNTYTKMAKEVVNPASSDSVSAEDKATPVELEKYDTAGEIIQIDPIVSARVTRKFDKRVVPLLFGRWLLAATLAMLELMVFWPQDFPRLPLRGIMAGR